MYYLYNYTLTPVNSNQLQSLILLSNISGAYSYIETISPNILNIYTTRELNGSEQTTLNNIISNYVYEAPVVDPGGGGGGTSFSVYYIANASSVDVPVNYENVVTNLITVDGIYQTTGKTTVL